jgi:hypothetical protein
MGQAAVQLSTEILNEAGKYTAVYSRSVPMQIEHWARIGKIAEENRACCKSRLLLHRLLQFLRLKPYETCIFKRLLLQN